MIPNKFAIGDTVRSTTQKWVRVVDGRSDALGYVYVKEVNGTVHFAEVETLQLVSPSKPAASSGAGTFQRELFDGERVIYLSTIAFLLGRKSAILFPVKGPHLSKHHWLCKDPKCPGGEPGKRPCGIKTKAKPRAKPKARKR